MKQAELEPGTIVRIKPDADASEWFRGKPLVVEECKAWGVQGYVQAKEGRAYYRAAWVDIEPTGEQSDRQENGPGSV